MTAMDNLVYTGRHVCITPLRFYERPTFVSVFTNQKNAKEDFFSLQKQVKSENRVQHLFCMSHYRGSSTPKVAQ